MPKRNLLVSLISILVVAFGLFLGNIIVGNTPSLGLDLQGGASVTMTPIGEYEEAALSVAVDIIRQRVDSIGVAEPEIIRQGDTVVVNLPGVKDQQQALDLIGRTGAVEMRPVLRTAENPENTTTTTGAKGATTTTVKGATSSTVAQSSTTLAPPSGGGGESRGRAVPQTTVPVATTVPGTDPETGLAPGQTVYAGQKDGLIYLLGPAGATGEVFTNEATAQIDAGGWAVSVNLRDGAAGEDQWNALAKQCFEGGEGCPSKQIAISLDGEVISAPVVQAPSFNGSVQITGSFTEKEANDLARILQFGAVPVKFDTPTVQTVSASLGEDSLKAALISGLIGVLLVLLFLIFYYRLIALVVVAGLGVSGLLMWSVVFVEDKRPFIDIVRCRRNHRVDWCHC